MRSRCEPLTEWDIRNVLKCLHLQLFGHLSLCRQVVRRKPFITQLLDARAGRPTYAAAAALAAEEWVYAWVEEIRPVQSRMKNAPSTLIQRLRL